MDLLFIEGLPGSGKSTLAEHLCETAKSNGISSSWYLEESKDHPIHPIKFKLEKHKKSFAEQCLKQWQKFISDNKDQQHLFILEGSLFQSTVRFMMEANNEHLVFDYYRACESILLQVKPQLIYLRPSDVTSHIDAVVNHRGEQWTSKVSTYLETTPYCIDRKLKGINGMNKFWSNYAQLCDALVKELKMSKNTIKTDIGIFEKPFEEAIRLSGLA